MRGHLRAVDVRDNKLLVLLENIPEILFFLDVDDSGELSFAEDEGGEEPLTFVFNFFQIERFPAEPDDSDVCEEDEDGRWWDENFWAKDA